MGFQNLLDNVGELVQHMRDDGHSANYIRRLETEIRWIARNGDEHDSYESACIARQAETGSPEMRRHYRLMFGILMRFDLHGEFPDYRMTRPLFAYGSRWQLRGEFAEVIESFEVDARRRGLEESTIRGDAANASRFLLAMSERGLSSLSDITEEDILCFFADDDGAPAFCSSYAKNVRTVLTSDLGPLTASAHAVASLLPHVRPKRKNVQYLQPEEVGKIRSALEDPEAALSLRDRAIGSLLLFAGLRACDVAGLEMGDVSWESDEIHIVQRKTRSPLALPLTAPIGNAIFDYLAEERPESGDQHVFLGLSKPHAPMTPGAVWHSARRIFDAAGIRPPGERRGTHLFRYNAATAMVGAGVARPVASAVLGHDDPNSLDYYLFADVVHLRECALDVGRFPVREGVFGI